METDEVQQAGSTAAGQCHLKVQLKVEEAPLAGKQFSDDEREERRKLWEETR